MGFCLVLPQAVHAASGTAAEWLELDLNVGFFTEKIQT